IFNMKKIIKFLDKPFIWFLFVLIFGMFIINESVGDALPEIILFIFAVVVWEYHRRKIDR
ncbi:MAG TPA: hypothetical protein PKD85_17640, partial [Saprospiraceae bacterium]|nr:hypothetical protein [Saprospiraceae bacterium]